MVIFHSYVKLPEGMMNQPTHIGPRKTWPRQDSASARQAVSNGAVDRAVEQQAEGGTESAWGVS